MSSKQSSTPTSQAKGSIANILPAHPNAPAIGKELVLTGLALAPISVSPSPLAVLLEKVPDQGLDLGQIKTSLRILAAVGDALPMAVGLKSAAAIVLEIVNVVETAKNNKPAWQAVALHAYQVISAIRKCSLDNPTIGNNIRELETNIHKVLDTVKSLSSQAMYKQVLRGDSIKQKLADCEKDIDRFIALFVSQINIAQSQVLHNHTKVLEDIHKFTKPLETKNALTANIKFSALLPPPPKYFVGRDKAVNEGILFVQQNPGASIAILGSGGIGKTALALTLIHHTAMSSTFGELRYFISCETLKTGLELLQALLQIFHVINAEDILAKLHDYIASLGDILLVLDNLETLWFDSSSDNGEVGKIIEFLVSMKSVTLIITMRGDTPPLNVDWDLILPSEGLGPLDLGAAKELYLQKQQKNKVLDDQAMNDLDLLLNEVDCIPLAITLLAALGHSYSPSVLYSRWQESKSELLKVPAQQASKLTSIAVSINLSLHSSVVKQNPDAARLLFLLAFLPEGLPNYTMFLKRFMDNAQDVYHAVDILCQTSLISRSHDQLNMLSPTRHYLNGSKQKPDTFQADLQHLLEYIKNAVNENSAEILKFGSVNIVHAFETLLEFEPTVETAYKCCECCFFLNSHDVYTPYLMELAESVLEMEISGQDENTDDIRPQYALQRCYMQHGILMFNLNLWAQAEEKYTQALNICIESQFYDNIGEVLESLSSALLIQGKYTESIERAEQAYNVYKVLEDKLGMAGALKSLGSTFGIQSRYDEAVEKLTEAHAIYKEIDHEVGMTNALQSLGETFRVQGKYAEAIDNHEIAYKIYEKYGNKMGMGNSLQSLGHAHQMQRKYAEALANHEQAYNLFSEVNNKHSVANALRSIGDALRSLGNYEEAEENLKEAYEIYVGLDHNKLGMANTSRTLGDMYHSQEKYREAEEWLENAYELFRQLGSRLGMANSSRSLGDVLFSQEKFIEAAEKHSRACDIYYDFQDNLGLGNALKGLGKALLQQEKYAEAREKLESAYETYKGLGNLHGDRGMARCLRSLAEIDDHEGNSEKAAEKRAEALELAEEGI